MVALFQVRHIPLNRNIISGYIYVCSFEGNNLVTGIKGLWREPLANGIDSAMIEIIKTFVTVGQVVNRMVC